MLFIETRFIFSYIPIMNTINSIVSFKSINLHSSHIFIQQLPVLIWVLGKLYFNTDVTLI